SDSSDVEPPPPVPASAAVSLNNDDSDRDTPLGRGLSVDSHETEPAINQQLIGASVQQENGETASTPDQDPAQIYTSSRRADETLDGNSSATLQSEAVAGEPVDESLDSTITHEAWTKGDQAQVESASAGEDSSQVVQYAPESPLERTEADSRDGRGAKPLSPRRPVPAEDTGEYRIAVQD